MEPEKIVVNISSHGRDAAKYRKMITDAAQASGRSVSQLMAEAGEREASRIRNLKRKRDLF